MSHRLAVAVALAVAVLPLSALDSANARAEYDRLQRWQFSPPVPLPAPVTLTRDTATWTLTSGTVRLMQPLADGTITGLVFEGQGTFKLTIPDRYELAQLRRFSRRPQIETLEQPFTQLVLRTSDAKLAKRFPAPGTAYSGESLASKRHDAWLVQTFEDVDARIVAALLNPGAEQFVADMHTADFDWLRYDYDSARAEEITILRSEYRGPEIWVSLDRPEDRAGDGRPAPGVYRAALEHIDVKADLTDQSYEQGRNHQRRLEGKYVVVGTFSGIADVTHALTLGLSTRAREVKAFSEGGAPLAVLRDHVGKRSMSLDNELHDDELYVVLDRPLKRGEKQRIRFEYTLETANYAPGRSWYPTVPEAFEQKHTARLELTVRKKNELRSMGRMESKTEQGSNETSIWVVDRPAKMVTFSTATRFEEVTVTPGGIPPVTSFGPDYQLSNTGKLHNVAADVANSMQYFQNLFDSKVSAEQFYVTSIAARHGQAFDGFLHMTEATYSSEHPGASELFRAHEVAHTWWGHKVGWKTYRDQWISEAFAEYSAMMFVRDFVKGGDRYFDEMLRSYEGIVKGNMAGGFSKFNRPWLIERSVTERARLGPIGHGYRASTFDIPAGYFIQTYYKGPLVLHMLRRLLGYRLGSDEVFIKTLRDFLGEYDGKSASTEDFRRVLERNLGGTDFGWFFDAWIYRAEIPSYTWSYAVKPQGNEFALTIELDRRDVGNDFVTVIPVRVEMEGGKAGMLFLPNKENKQTFTFKIPARAKNVVFGPDSSLLAYVKRN